MSEAQLSHQMNAVSLANCSFCLLFVVKGEFPARMPGIRNVLFLLSALELSLNECACIVYTCIVLVALI